MAYTPIPDYVTNQQITAAHGNTYWKNNFAALFPYAAIGDMAYASATDVLARLGIGTEGQALKVISGLPGWGNGGMTLIEQKLATGAVANFDFTSIPSTYKHLKILFAGCGDTNADVITIALRFNGDSGNYYDDVYFYIASDGTEANGDGGTIGSSAMSLWRVPALTRIAGMVGTSEITIFKYASTVFFKNVHTMNLCQEDTADNIIESMWKHGMWRKTAAINRITLFPGGGNFIAGSIASLYGME